MSVDSKPHPVPVTWTSRTFEDRDWVTEERYVALVEHYESLIEQLETLQQEWRSLLTEVDCRIEHGAESDGHLEYVRDRMKTALFYADEPGIARLHSYPASSPLPAADPRLRSYVTGKKDLNQDRIQEGSDGV